jgi:fucose permease
MSVGALGHRVRPRVLLLSGAVVQVVAVVAFASVQSLEIARMVALVYGAAGVADVTATAILARAGGARRGHLLSLAHGSYALGSVIVPLAAGFVLEAGGTWRLLFAMVAGLNALVLVWLVLSGAGREVASQQSTGATVHQSAGVALWKNGKFRRGALAMALYIAAETGPSIWLPTWFRDRFGASVPVAAASVAVFWASMTAGRLLMAGRVDLDDARRFVARLSLIAAAAWVVVLLSGQIAVAFIGVAVFGLAMSICAPALQGFAARPFPGLETSVIGWLSAAAGMVGAISPWVVGAVAERLQDGQADGGFGLTWALAGGPAFLLAMSLVVGRSTGSTAAGKARPMS